MCFQLTVKAASVRPVVLNLKVVLFLRRISYISILSDMITRFLSQCQIIPNKLQIDELLIFDVEEVEV